jgi:hypothetical protein
MKITISREAFAAISLWGCSKGFPTLERNGLLLLDAEFLVEQLRLTPDSPAVFPKGKWATIQALQADMQRCAATNPIG